MQRVKCLANPPIEIGNDATHNLGKKMRVNSIGPLGASQVNEPDKDIELKVGGLRPELDSEIKEPDPDSALDGEEQDTREGLIRLVDYLQRQRQANRRRPKTGNKQKDKALSSYHQLEQTEDSIALLGKNYDRKA